MKATRYIGTSELSNCGNDVMRIWLYRLVFVIASFLVLQMACFCLPRLRGSATRLRNYMPNGSAFVMFHRVHVMLFHVTLCYVMYGIFFFSSFYSLI